MYTNIQYFKKNLNIENDYNDEDTYLLNLLQVAELQVDNYLNGGMSGFTGTTGTTAPPATIKQAVYLLATHYYLNRTIITPMACNAIPYSFSALLDFYKNDIIL